MIKLKYGDIYLPIIDSYDITKSSQEVQFSSLKCDFTGYIVDDLPEKYQEVRLVDINYLNIERIIYTGFIDKIDFEEMRETDADTIISISLFSPMKMATLRTTDAVGTYRLKSLIQEVILLPLIEDGFTLEELDISDRTTTPNFLCETVEYCMNDLSNKYNFWWFIDEKKKIYVKDLEQMFKGEPNYKYDDENRIEGLLYIKPSISSDDYANVVNFKNVRIYEYSRLLFDGKTIIESHNSLIDKQIASMSKNDILEFKHPVDITKSNIEKSANSNGINDTKYGLFISGMYTDNTTFELYIRIPFSTENYEMSNNIAFDGDANSNADFLLIRDSFFSNLITGFRYNNESKKIKSLISIKSDSALIWNVNKLYNDKAIASKAGKISKTGIVEKTIDMNESWKTIQELREIGISHMNKNSIEYYGEVEMMLDNLNNMKVGNTIYINKLSFDSTYIITKIRSLYANNDEEHYVTCKNANLLNNFIDIFRGEESQKTSDKVFQIYVTHYSEESLNEKHEVVQ